MFAVQEEKDARQGDAAQIYELSVQLSEALAALQRAKAASPTESISKLQMQLAAVQQSLDVRATLACPNVGH